MAPWHPQTDPRHGAKGGQVFATQHSRPPRWTPGLSHLGAEAGRAGGEVVGPLPFLRSVLYPSIGPASSAVIGGGRAPTVAISKPSRDSHGQPNVAVLKPGFELPSSTGSGAPARKSLESPTSPSTICHLGSSEVICQVSLKRGLRVCVCVCVCV